MWEGKKLQRKTARPREKAPTMAVQTTMVHPWQTERVVVVSPLVDPASLFRCVLGFHLGPRVLPWIIIIGPHLQLCLIF